MVLKRKLTINKKVKIIQKVELNPTVSQTEFVQRPRLLVSINIITLWKVSVLEEEGWCGAHLNKIKT
jgi:hypothetical protein